MQRNCEDHFNILDGKSFNPDMESLIGDINDWSGRFACYDSIPPSEK